MARKKSKLTEKAYTYLLERMVDFEIRPGEIISDSSVAAILGTSREPVREAFMRLESEGLIYRGPNNYFCAELTIEDIKEICCLRSDFESLAVSLIKASGGLTEEQKKELSDIFIEIRKDFEDTSEHKDYRKRYHNDDLFHEKIVRFSKNSRLINMFSLMQLQISRARWLNLLSPRTKATLQEHQDIYDALMEDRYDDCMLLVRKHIENSEANFLRIINSPEYRLVNIGSTMLSKNL
ncbi:MAG: GntR family transcriptional regulator [Spirochaetales bacterium]|nr:GntR family transcriptional regulator [Spirochaetales bacterium]